MATIKLSRRNLLISSILMPAAMLIPPAAAQQPAAGKARQRALDSFEQLLSRNAPHWTSIGRQPLDLGSATAIAVDPRDSNTAYAGFDGGGVWKTTSGGSHWTPLTDDQPVLAIRSLALDPTNPDTIYAGTAAGILKSTDAGATWTQIRDPFATAQGWLEVRSIAFSGPRLLAAAGSAVYRSADAGKTWDVTLASERAALQVVSDAANAYAVLDGAGVFRSVDAGLTWSPVTGLPLSAQSVATATGVQYATTDRAGFYKSIDNGSTWQRVSTPPTDGHSALAIHPANTALVYAGGYQSRDGGVTWKHALENTSAQAFAADGARLYSGNPHGLFSTENPAGDAPAWTDLSGTLATAVIPAAISVANAVAGLPQRALTQTLADPVNPQVAYKTFSGFAAATPALPGHVYLTTNGGATWSDVSGDLPDIPVNGLATDSEILYAATGVGVYRSVDNGKNWQPFGAGLPHTPVTTITLNPATKTLLAGTYGRGTWTLPSQATGQVRITIGASIPGAPFALEDGTTYQAPTTFTWTSGTGHTITWLSAAGVLGTRWAFQTWQDTLLASNPRTIFVPASDSAYTANVKLQYLLTTSVSPIGAGTILTTPSSADSFFDAGTVLQVGTLAASGYNFSGYSGDLSGIQNSQLLTMNAPRSITANFACILTLTATLSGRQGPGPATGFIQWTSGAGCTSTIVSDSAWLVLGGTSATGNATIPFSISQNTGFVRTAVISIFGAAQNSMTVIQDNPSTALPSVEAISPTVGTGTSQMFTLQIYEGTGYQNIDTVNVDFPLNGGCNISFTRTGQQWYGALQSNSGLTTNTIAVPSFATVANNQCQLAGNQFAVAGGGTTLTLTFGVNFTNAFLGVNQVLAQAGISSTNLYSPFNMVGSWTVGLPGCSYSLTSNAALYGSMGGSSAVTLNAGSTCAWTASSDSSWLTVTSATTGTGSASISYAVAPNSVAGFRTGILTIAGQQYTVTEGSPASAVLSISLSHSGNFYQGQQPASYSIVVSNAAGAGPASGTVSVTDMLPAGLTFASMSGTGWNCAANTCTRVDFLNAGSAYPPIIVTVNIIPGVASSVTNSATVAGGGSVTPATATDVTMISSIVVNGPSVISLSPVVSSGNAQVFTFQFADPAGASNLGVLNVIINSALDGRQGCYLAYVVQTNTLYLVADSGDPASLAGGVVLQGFGGVANHQCTVIGGGSFAVINGTTLTLTLNMTFSSSFGGNKVVYAAAGDTSLNNSGWQTMGVHGVMPLPATFPIPVNVSPSSGSTANTMLTFTWADATNSQNILPAWALINTATDGRQACYIAYYQPGNLVFLVPDNGDGTQATSMTLNGTNSLSNSQCTVSSQGSYVTSNGSNQLILNLNITFNHSFSGPKGVWMAVETLDSQVSQWQPLGAWVVP